jgi:basic membrane protein A and related proteins
MTDLVGHSLGRYHIIEPLGEGGMAMVYKAYDTRLERDVAIKVIRVDQFTPASLANMLARFEREAKLLARLSHPNIVSVIDYGEYENVPYLVMVYLPGGTLKGRLLGKPMPWRESFKLLLPIAQALDYAHEQHLIHRDIKPSNILLTQKGQPMLTDFGIAKILETEEVTALTGTGMSIGTPEYMAPEQWTGGTSPQSDIYSLGVVLYEMVTGRKPYTADTPAAILLKQAGEPLPRPRQYVPDLPDEVEKVLIKALAKQPEDRYQTMDEFAGALEGLISITGLYKIEPNSQQAVSPNSPVEQAEVSSQVPDDSQTEIAQQVASSVAKSDAVAAQSTMNQYGPAQAKVAQPIQEKQHRPFWHYGLAAIGLVVLIAMMVVLFIQLSKPQATLPVPTQLPAATVITPLLSTATALSPKTSTPTREIPLVSGPLDCRIPEVFCVGLVTDVGKVDDRSFNQSAWEAVKLAEKGLGAKVQYIETTDAKDYDKNIAIFADEGYDVIVTVGYALNEATAKAAAAYPNVKFIGVDQFQDVSKPLPANLIGLTFPEDQAGFLAGALAAQMSTTKKIGAVCGTDTVPPVWRYGEGYRAGAAYIDPAVEVNVIYHNDVGFDKTFVDPEWGALTANSMMDKGVDVIFGCGGKTGNGAVTAAAQRGAYAIGVDTDQYFTLPEAARQMLSSAMKLITPGVFDLIKMAKEGSMPSGNFIGPVGYAPYHDLDSKVPAAVKTGMEEIQKALAVGSLKTNVPPAKP